MQQVCVMSALLTGRFGDFVRRSLSMPNESKKIDGQQRVELTHDFFGESRHELTAKLAYQHWERRGMPLGSPEVDWFAAERDLYESLVASGLVSPSESKHQDMQQEIYHQ
jgi:Protein of unknown function (DUF2934)